MSVNLSELSRRLGKHMNTIKNKVISLFEHGIINRPVFPFIGMYKEYPILALVYSDLPHTEKIEKWLKEDIHIFGAFKLRKGEYNTIRYECHKDITDYHNWRESLVKSGKVPPRDNRHPSDVLFLSHKLIMKYAPNIGINLIEREFNRHQKLEIEDYKLDRVDIQIMKLLVEGQGIKVNENFLSERVGLNRKTINRRIDEMIKDDLILKPLCRFPKFFVPPGFLLTFSLVEVRKDEEDLLDRWIEDPHISIIYKVSSGRYNFLLVGNYLDIDDHLQWEERYLQEFPGCIGQMSLDYITPKMMVAIDRRKISLGIINERLISMKNKNHYA